MRIGELAASVGLTVDTIRFYERRGLLGPAHMSRATNNYRAYSTAAITRLELVKQGQAAGLTLAEIAEGIDDWESDRLTSEEKRAIFTRKLADIQRRIEELERLRDYLSVKIARMPHASRPVTGVTPSGWPDHSVPNGTRALRPR